MSQYGGGEAIRLGAAQSVTSVAGPTSTASAAFGTTTYQVLITSSAAINFRISDGTPTAVAADTLLPANFPMRFIVTPGQKFASVGVATVSITELTG